MESHARSIVKALSCRVVATIITFTIALLLTGSMDTAIKIGLLDTLIKLSAYYGHERAWMKLKFGKLQSPDYQI
jgi:uncharacterized membrane protein